MNRLREEALRRELKMLQAQVNGLQNRLGTIELKIDPEAQRKMHVFLEEINGHLVVDKRFGREWMV